MMRASAATRILDTVLSLKTVTTECATKRDDLSISNVLHNTPTGFPVDGGISSGIANAPLVVSSACASRASCRGGTHGVQADYRMALLLLGFVHHGMGSTNHSVRTFGNGYIHARALIRREREDGQGDPCTCVGSG
jgi:hypothetical protein